LTAARIWVGGDVVADEGGFANKGARCFLPVSESGLD
jgi:hypothetical protein